MRLSNNMIAYTLLHFAFDPILHTTLECLTKLAPPLRHLGINDSSCRPYTVPLQLPIEFSSRHMAHANRILRHDTVDRRLRCLGTQLKSEQDGRRFGRPPSFLWFPAMIDRIEAQLRQFRSPPLRVLTISDHDYPFRKPVRVGLE